MMKNSQIYISNWFDGSGSFKKGVNANAVVSDYAIQSSLPGNTRNQKWLAYKYFANKDTNANAHQRNTWNQKWPGRDTACLPGLPHLSHRPHLT